MTLSLSAIQLGTLCITTLLYGCFITLCVLAAVISYDRYKKHFHGRQWHSRWIKLWMRPSVFASISLCITITGHWVALVYRAFQAFILFNNGQTPKKFYTDLTQYSERFTNAFLIISLLTWDAVIVYRLFTVWGRWYPVIIFPCCTWIGHAIAGITVVALIAKAGNAQNFYHDKISPWLTAYAVLILVTNLYCTSLITFRIWWHSRIMRLTGLPSSAGGLLGIFVESALVYTTWNVFYIFVYLLKSPMEFFALNVWVPMAGISFFLITIRVGLGYGYSSESTRPTDQSASHPLTTIISNMSRAGDSTDASMFKDGDT